MEKHKYARLHSDLSDEPFSHNINSSFISDEDGTELPIIESKDRTEKVKYLCCQRKLCFGITLKILLLSLSVLLLLVLMNVMYVLSLEPGPIKPFDFMNCVEYIKDQIGKWTIELFISALGFYIITLLAIKNIINRYWCLPAIVNLIILFFIQSDTSFNNHGGLNRIGLLLFIVVIYICYGIYLGLKRIWKIGLISKIILLVILIAFPFVIYFTIMYHTCEGWLSGLGDTFLDNTNGEGLIEPPKYGELEMRKGWFDFVRFSSTGDQRKMTVDFSSLNTDFSKTKSLGFPRIEQWENVYRIDEQKFLTHVRENMIDMDDQNIPNSVKDNIEFTINMTNPHEHYLEVNVKRNN